MTQVIGFVMASNASKNVLAKQVAVGFGLLMAFTRWIVFLGAGS